MRNTVRIIRTVHLQETALEILKIVLFGQNWQWLSLTPIRHQCKNVSYSRRTIKQFTNFHQPVLPRRIPLTIFKYLKKWSQIQRLIAADLWGLFVISNNHPWAVYDALIDWNISLIHGSLLSRSGSRKESQFAEYLRMSRHSENSRIQLHVHST